MQQPEPLKTDHYLPWSCGTGTDVWAMFRAATSGNLAEIRRLVGESSSLATCEYAYFTPLHFAAREGHLDVVRYLVEHGADPTSAVPTGWNDLPLTMAKDRGHDELRAWLEEYLAERHGVVPEGESIAEAIRSKDLNRVVRLLDEARGLLDAADSRGNQPIHWAVMTRQMALIDLLVERGANLDAERPDGARPLHLTHGDYFYRGWRDVPADALREHVVLIGYLLARGAFYGIETAARLGDTRRVRELLEADAGLANRVPAYCNYYGGLPLAQAAAGGHLETVTLLLEHGADPNLAEPCAPRGRALYEAVSRNHLAIARLLLEHGADPNAHVESSGDCCWRARRDGHAEMLSLLSEYGGAPDFACCCYSGWTDVVSAMLKANPALAAEDEALSNAMEEGQRELVCLFLRHDPDVMRKLPGGLSGFHNREMAELALDHGLDPGKPNWLGVTPLHFFALHGKRELAELFLDRGAKIDAVDDEYRSTPLGWAAREGQRGMVELLLERGAAFQLSEGPAWAQPRMWAERRGFPDVVELLTQR